MKILTFLHSFSFHISPPRSLLTHTLLSLIIHSVRERSATEGTRKVREVGPSGGA